MAEALVAEFQDEELKKFFKDMKVRLAAVTGAAPKFMGLLSAVVFADIQDHFQKEEGPDGPWAKWSPYYEKHLQSIGRAGNKKLQFSGRMRQNFKPTDVRSVTEGILWFNDALTKSGFPYAAAHDAGGDQLPARPFMWMSDGAAEKISQVTLQFLLDEGV